MLSETFRKAEPKVEDDSFYWVEEKHVANVLTPRNVISYQFRDGNNFVCRLFVSETEFSRNISQVVRGRDSKTITFPNTVREVCGNAFQGSPLSSAVLNEGLETLGEYKDNWHDAQGIFCNTQIRCVTLPSTLEELGDATFRSCKHLKRVTFAPGSRLKRIGSECFFEAGIEEIFIPKSVVEIRDSAFYECEMLREVVFEKGSELRALGRQSLNDYADFEQIDLPDGFKRIECGVFANCSSLRTIQLPDKLERIGISCFSGSGIEDIVFPASMREIGSWAFQ